LIPNGGVDLPSSAKVTKIVRASGNYFVANLDNGLMRFGIHNQLDSDVAPFKISMWINDAEFESLVLDLFDQSNNAKLRRRIFVGVFPGGISYADREREEYGDYKRLAFLPFESLALEWSAGCSPDVKEWIAESAKYYQSRRGQQFQISQSGQTVLLGSR
jgi:hypothetical protein